MPKSTVSRKVSELERRLGARLLHRTTRKLSLTDVGRAFYRHAARVVQEIEEAERAVSHMQEVPRGRLRVSTPLNFGYLSPLVTSFLHRFPEVQLELVCTDRVLDLIDEGFDVAVRVGPLADSTLVARHLGGLESFVVASPSFIENQGIPDRPEALRRFECLVFGGRTDPTKWRLRSAEKTLVVDVKPRLVVNDFDFLDEAVRNGLGIAMMPVFRCVKHLRSGLLRRILPDWCSVEIPIHVVYPSTRHLSPKVRAFVDHLREQMASPP